MSSFYSSLKKSFSSTLSLVRVELFFGACFGQFYALLFHVLSDINYNQTIINIYSIVFLLVLFLSFFLKKYVKEYRIVSNALFLLGCIYILFVAFINNYDSFSFFLVIFNYVIVSFSMPNFKALGVVSAFFYWTFLMSYFFLDFDAETPFLVAFLSLVFTSSAAFFIVLARHVYKSRVKEREQLLNYLFNNSNDGLMLVDYGNFKIKECNILIEKIFNKSKDGIIGKDILKYDLKGKKPFTNLKSFGKETIELNNKEIIHYQKKKLKYLNKLYLLIQVKKFKSRFEINNTYTPSRE